MPYFVGQTAASGAEMLRAYFGENFDERTQPREQSSYHQREAYFGDPERSRDPSLAEEVPPLYLRLFGDRKSLPDLIVGADGQAHLQVSDRVRRVIEHLEPARHYFSPLVILKRDGLTPWHERYWLFRAAGTAVAQTMIVEQSSSLAWEPINPPFPRFGKWMSCIDRYGDKRPISQWSTSTASGFVVDVAAFETRHIVLEDVLRYKSILFFSNALVKALKLQKVRGFKFVQVKAEQRRVAVYGDSSGTGAVTETGTGTETGTEIN